MGRFSIAWRRCVTFGGAHSARIQVCASFAEPCDFPSESRYSAVMKVHLRQIPNEGKHYEGEDPNTMLELHEGDAVPVSPVRYSLDVGLSGGGLWAAGQLSADFRVNCVNCLEAFVYPAEAREFAIQVELTGAETVDLTEPMREDILLALPAHPHCDWNGAKVCPGAFHPATNETPDPEPPAETRDVWEALDQLKLKS